MTDAEITAVQATTGMPAATGHAASIATRVASRLA